MVKSSPLASATQRRKDTIFSGMIMNWFSGRKLHYFSCYLLLWLLYSIVVVIYCFCQLIVMLSALIPRVQDRIHDNMDGRNFSPFYRTSSPTGAAALLLIWLWSTNSVSRARVPLTIWCLWATGSLLIRGVSKFCCIPIILSPFSSRGKQWGPLSSIMRTSVLCGKY